jgi:phosphoserine phosphatase RsbU/P
MSDTMVVDVSQDWTAACDVQQGFMHHAVPAPDGIGYAARCRQLRALGGDCHDFLPLAHNSMAFVIGDASGKSLPAALMMANVQSSLRTAAFFVGNEPTAVLGTVNRQLHTSSLAGRFATLFYGVFHPATGTLRYGNAGHNSPLVIRPDGSTVLLETTGLPLGPFPDAMYDEGIFRLDPGDVLIAYTDGLVEAVNETGEEWGMDGLRRAALESQAKHAGELLDTIFASFDKFTQGRQTDDATAVVLFPH